MTSVSRLSGAEPNVVRKAADAVRGNDFAADIPVKKLARSTKDREIRVEVVLCLGSSFGADKKGTDIFS